MEEKNDYIKIGYYHLRNNGNKTYACAPIPGCPGVEGWGCMCFKDEEIFLNEPQEVCYIAECMFLNSFDEDLQRWCLFEIGEKIKHCYGEATWTHDELLEASIAYLKKTNLPISPEELAYRVFCDATWSLHATPDSRLGITSNFHEAAQQIMKEKEKEQQQ